MRLFDLKVAFLAKNDNGISYKSFLKVNPKTNSFFYGISVYNDFSRKICDFNCFP